MFKIRSTKSMSTACFHQQFHNFCVSIVYCIVYRSSAIRNRSQNPHSASASVCRSLLILQINVRAQNIVANIHYLHNMDSPDAENEAVKNQCLTNSFSSIYLSIYLFIYLLFIMLLIYLTKTKARLHEVHILVH